MKIRLSFFILVFVLFSFQTMAQTGINFQGVARSETGVIMASQNISLRLSILSGSSTGAVDYSETIKTKTNAQGLFAVVIGDVSATNVLGNFANIDWKQSPKFLKIEMDPAAADNFILIGTTQLQSVAYAKFAEGVDAANINGVLPLSKGGTGKTSLADIKIALQLDKVNNTTDLDKPISTATQSALDLKANSADLTTKASITLANSKEDTINKSKSVATDATSDIKYPTVKAVKSYIDEAVVSGAPDATSTTKGKIALSGALTGTAESPAIADNVIVTSHLQNSSVTNEKIVSLDGEKITGNISGKAANITGIASIVNGGTGASNATDARTNLGVTIGTDVEYPLSFTAPLTRVSNAVSMPVASSSVNGYLSSADWSSFNSKINGSEKGTANGVPSLDANGKIPSTQIPAISFQSANVVATETAMLALSNAVVGSIAIRTDNNKNYVLSYTPASTLSNWIELATPSSVTSVNGFAGPNVSLTTNNITEGTTNKYFSNTLARNAISATTPMSYDASTGVISLPMASMSQAGYLDYTDWIAFNSKMGTASATATFVPYTGATGPVNLGNYDLTVNGITVGKGGGSNSLLNLAFGKSVLQTNASGKYNSAFGMNSMSENISGSINSAFGNGSLKSNKYGSGNSAFGSIALYYNTSGNANSAFGNSALTRNNTGNYNTAIGNSSLGYNTTGSDNIAIGSALYYNGNGNWNVGIGNSTLYNNISGSWNTAIGASSLYTNSTGTYNTAIGNRADVASADLTNATAIGNGATVTESYSMQLGDANLRKIKSAAKLTTGAVTYPNTDGTDGQVLTTNGQGVLFWTAASTNLSTMTGVVNVTNGGTGANNAVDARTNLGLTIGTDVEFPLKVIGPLIKNVDKLSMPPASFSSSGYLSASDWLEFKIKISGTEKGANNGVATLDANGKIPSTQIPAISFQSANVVSSENAMLNLSGALVGSIAIRTDNNKNFVLSATPASTLANWVELATPNTVASVNGIAGPNISLTTDHIAEGPTNKYFSKTDARGAINVMAPLTYDASVGTISIPKANDQQSGYLDYTDWITFNSKMSTASATASFVPYTGATKSVNLGPFDMYLNGITIGNGANKINSNHVFGFASMDQNTTGTNNSVFGSYAMKKNTEGNYNTVMGQGALYNNTTGNANVAIGNAAMLYNTTGNSNTAIGSEAGVTTGDLINTTAIGAGAVVNTSNTIQLGNNNVTDLKTAAKLTTGTVTYPNTDGINGQFLSTTGSGTLTWTSITGISSQTITTTSLSDPFDLTAYTGLNGSSIDIRTAENLANGTESLISNTDGIANVAVGIRTLKSNTIGAANTALGFETLFSNTTGQNNTGVGAYALRSNTTGSYNSAFGSVSLLSNTTGFGNAAFGEWSLLKNTTGKLNSSFGANALMRNISGEYNTAHGGFSLESNTTGNYNVATGAYALFKNTTANWNTANGYGALNANTTGNSNTASGAGALSGNTTANWNTAFGSNALLSNTTGSSNTAVGGSALYNNISGSNNVALGLNSLMALTTGSNNIAIGASSNVSSGTLSNSIVIGYGAVVNNSNTIQLGNNDITDVKTTGKLTTGTITYPNAHGTNGQVLTTTGSGTLTWTTNNSTIQSSALSNGYLSSTDWNTFNNKQNTLTAGTGVTIASNSISIGQDVSTTASPSFASINGIPISKGGGSIDANTTMGIDALISNTTGQYNTAVGNGALKVNTTGIENSSFGSGSLYNNTTGLYNTATGGLALHYSVSGNYNTANGALSLKNNTTGGYNTAIGSNALIANTTGSFNTAIGSNALGNINNLQGSFNTAIGYAAGPISNGLSNTIAIGNNAQVTASNTIQLGNTNVTDLITSAKLTTGAVTYPNAHGTNGQMLTTTGSGTLTWTTPQSVDLSNITGVLSIAKGGTGTSTQNFVDLTDDQSIAGNKTFTSGTVTIGLNNRANASSIVFPHVDDPAFINHYSSGNQAKMNFSAGDDVSNDYFVFGYGSPSTFVEKLKISSNGILTAPLDATINGVSIGMGNGSLYGNTILGNSNLSVTTGQYNTAIGNAALKFNTSGSANTAIGNEVMQSNTTGGLNIAVGSSTLMTNTSGSRNTAIGTSAMYVNTSGSDNSVLGYHSLNSNTIGSENLAIGNDALFNNVAGSRMVAIGNGAMKNANNQSSAYTPYSNALGFEALRGSGNAVNNTGIYNNAFGSFALANYTSGSYNTAIGYQSMLNNASGEYNIAMGNQALLNNVTGSNNVALGASALYNTTNNYNTAIGNATLITNTTGAYNTAIGYGANVGSGTLSNSTAIGYNALVVASNSIQLGNSSITSINAQVALTVASDKRIKTNIVNSKYGLKSVLQLRPVSYTLKNNGLNQIGFIAQEVKKIIPEVVTGKEGDLEKGEILGITYENIVPVLTKAIQEQQEIINKQSKSLEDLQKQINELKNLIISKK